MTTPHPPPVPAARHTPRVIPELGRLPAAHWRPAEAAAARVLTLTPVGAGVHLGTGTAGQPVTLPAPSPEGAGLGVLGESLFGRLFALRLLGVGARVTAATRVPDKWRGLTLAAGDRLTVGDGVGRWPERRPSAPSAGDGPQALVCDLRRPPSASLADGPWRTVVHVARNPPRRSAFWAAARTVVVLDGQYAEVAERLLGPGAGAFVAALRGGEIAVFRDGRAETVRLDLSPGENALLTPGRRQRPAGG
ncbi:hypothetical protein FH609_009605 [Streptomyces sp. 3MP-14]|uniref:Uncharacterized protein n=1 Tax=Streptomyces mimosae TaxID=2586635 RepID=A0A5N6AIN1_9ACTN|nr:MULTISPECIES: hypothetical protein [Streptomyces]KAB8167876.1 hypothetical protein FH607_007815 [Streptomyces mimosae]KAB8177476.1 hypothetical protein FH609_009605 [Streptomyces sp. 3MP-14]